MTKVAELPRLGRAKRGDRDSEKVQSTRYEQEWPAISREVPSKHLNRKAFKRQK